MLDSDATYTTKGNWGGYYTDAGSTTFWTQGKGSVLVNEYNSTTTW